MAPVIDFLRKKMTDRIAELEKAGK
jgi:hypothetical protein